MLIIVLDPPAAHAAFAARGYTRYTYQEIQEVIATLEAADSLLDSAVAEAHALLAPHMLAVYHGLMTYPAALAQLLRLLATPLPLVTYGDRRTGAIERYPLPKWRIAARRTRALAMRIRHHIADMATTPSPERLTTL